MSTYNTIYVEFWEKGKEAPFAQSNIPIEQLPDTFELNTSLDLADTHWSVLKATPPGKKEFAQSGKLTLLLAKVEKANPQEIYYSLPTINESLPQTLQRETLERLLFVSEDDWRQIEFISVQFETLITEEIEATENIYSSAVDGIGFRTIHLREKIQAPLDPIKITIETLSDFFTIQTKYSGVAFRTVKGVIENSFALHTKEYGILWGQTDSKGKILYLNLKNSDEKLRSYKEMDRFLSQNQLKLIDWTDMLIFGKDDLSFRYYL